MKFLAVALIACLAVSAFANKNTVAVQSEEDAYNTLQ